MRTSLLLNGFCALNAVKGLSAAYMYFLIRHGVLCQNVRIQHVLLGRFLHRHCCFTLQLQGGLCGNHLNEKLVKFPLTSAAR